MPYSNQAGGIRTTGLVTIGLRILLVIVAVAMASQVTGISLEAGPRRNVLILHSYHKGLWTDSVLRGIESELGTMPGTDLFIEYMDTKHVNTPEYLQHLTDIYRLKYGQLRLDLVVTSDDNAFHFALDHRSSLFRNAPIVFCAVNHFRMDLLAGRNRVTGVLEQGDFADTLTTALKMRPDCDKVFVICDRTQTGQINRKTFERVVADQFPDIQFEFLQDISLATLETKLRQLPSNDFAFFISFWQDSEGRPVSPEQLEELFRASAVPIFGRSEWMIGKGLAGGKCVSGFLQGSTAGRLAKQIFSTDNPGAIPIVTKSPNQFMFDYEILERYSIPASNIPAASIVINRPKESLSVHRSTAITIGITIVALMLIIFLLSFNIVLRRRAQTALSKSETKYRVLVESANSIIMRMDSEGKVTLFNDFAQKFFGYNEDEILGKNVIGTLFAETDSTGKDIRAIIGAIYRNSGSRMNLVIESVLRNNARVWIAWTHKPMIMPDGSKEILCVGNDITDRKRAEEALQKSEERFRELAELLPETIFEIDISGNLTFVNRKAYDHFLVTREEVQTGLNVFDLRLPEERPRARVNADRVLLGEVLGITEYRALRRNGSTFPVLVHTSRIVRGEQTVGLRGFVIDITETKKLEQQLQQAQKMEAIGTLAGGIAHDFNNLLQAIQGYSELLLIRAKAEQSSHSELSAINKAARRAAELTQQLLAFSRNMESRLKPTDLNQVVERTRVLLERTIPKMIRIELRLTANLQQVQADATQLEQVLMNLAINARDAMAEGGTLRIETAEAAVPGQLQHQQPVREAGQFVRLKVSDTGSGMDAETMQHMYDPFFTTKEVGKGTGLGLAMVFGIVKNHRGYLDCDSEPGRGTSFEIYLPAIPGVAEIRKPRADRGLPGGTETILLVDDEENIRNLGMQVLGEFGYRVLTAADGRQAIATYKKQGTGIDLVLLDLIMPRMGGIQCLEKLMEIDPEIKAIIVSGYSPHNEGVLPADLGHRLFVKKPFQLRDLLVALRTELDA